MRERAWLRGACDAAARRWLHHLVAAALRAWREHGALWQRVLLGLGRRSARDELRRGTLTWPNPNPNPNPDPDPNPNPTPNP